MAPCNPSIQVIPLNLNDKIVHLVGSPTDEFNFNLNIFYGSGFDTKKHQEFEHVWAIIRPQDKRWTFTKDLSTVLDLKSFKEINKSEVEWFDLPTALQILTTEIKPALVMPHMFCPEGIIKYRSLLETLKIPFIGSSSEKTTIAINKQLTRSVMLGFDIPCPPGKIILKDSEFDMNEFKYPCVVKPTTTENTVGMSLVPSPDLMQKALDLAFQYGNEVIIDKFIQGREVRCSVIEQIDSLGNLNLLATVPHEYHICQKSLRKTEDKILVDENGLPTGKATHNKTTFIEHNEEPELVDRIQSLAKKIHRVMGYKDFSMVDLRIDQQGNPWVLESNLFCSFGAKSILCIQAQSLGMDDVQVFKTMVDNALRRKK